MKYYLIVQGSDLEDVRFVGNDLLASSASTNRGTILDHDQSDPLMTHSAENDVFFPHDGEEEKS